MLRIGQISIIMERSCCSNITKGINKLLKIISSCFTSLKLRKNFEKYSIPSKHSFWWRCLENVLKTSFVFAFRGRLQDVLFKTNIFVLAIRLQDVFKTSSKRLQDFLKNVFKTYSRRLQEVLKTPSRHLQDVLQTHLHDVFKMYHQVKLFLLTRLWEAFNTFPRRSFPKTVIYRGIYLSNATSDKFMVSVPNLQER